MPVCFQVKLGIGQQHPDVGLQVLEEQVVSLQGLLDGKPVGNQLLHLHPPLGHQVQKDLEIAALRPPHLSDGIVEPLGFIQGCEASRSGRLGNRKDQLFFPEGFAGEA